MSKLTIEFFHDVICSFCFPMSHRMRRVKELMPEIEIVHRSFALVKTEDDFVRMFGSRVAAKEEILSHWKHANENDDLHRFNIQGMKESNFLFPISMPALLACKAAFFVAGEEGYWDVFDALQHALFVLNLDIEDHDIIAQCVEQSGVDLVQWQAYYESEQTKKAVEEDLVLVGDYGIHSVPSLVFNGEHILSGAQPLDNILATINSLLKRLELKTREGGSCTLHQDTLECK